MQANWYVLGEGETVLYGPATEKEARDWLSGYLKTGFGGWESIDLVCQYYEAVETYGEGI